MKSIMATIKNTRVSTRVCPRCDICGRAVRTLGLGLDGVWCKICLSENLPFANILSERDYNLV